MLRAKAAAVFGQANRSHTSRVIGPLNHVFATVALLLVPFLLSAGLDQVQSMSLGYEGLDHLLPQTAPTGST